MFGADKFDPDPTAPDVVYVKFAKVKGGYSGTVRVVLTSGAWDPETVFYPSCMAVQFIRTVGDNASKGLPDPSPTDAPAAEPTPSELPQLPPSDKPPDPVMVPPPPPVAPPPAWPPPLSNVGAHPFNSLNDFRWYMNLSISLSTIVLLTAGFSDNVGPGFGLGLEFSGKPPTWVGMGLSIGFEFRGVPPARVTAHEPIDPTKTSTPVELEMGQVSGLVVPCFRFAKYLAACGVAQWGGRYEKGPLQQAWDVTQAYGPRFAVEIPFAERFAVVGLGEVLFNPGDVTIQFPNPPLNNPAGPPVNVSWREPLISGFIGIGVAAKFD
jgi:hypothetical protein